MDRASNPYIMRLLDKKYFLKNNKLNHPQIKRHRNIEDTCLIQENKCILIIIVMANSLFLQLNFSLNKD